jgi:hypothetical protein
MRISIDSELVHDLPRLIDICVALNPELKFFAPNYGLILNLIVDGPMIYGLDEECQHGHTEENIQHASECSNLQVSSEWVNSKTKNSKLKYKKGPTPKCYEEAAGQHRAP